MQATNVKESFASSVLASLPVEAEEGGKVLVDATSLFMRDAADIFGDLARLNQGRFRFDAGSQRVLSRAHEGLSGQHRDRDAWRRSVWRRRGRS